ncbi:hypothetical protein [Brevibacillus migulae]|uniref:hypothetical protein n=1 Tax=Brevibacillus migulae TaxID=1644114 RepID=UPI00106E85BA|nr:hypothetical protein [Brevibacillus migulae]
MESVGVGGIMMIIPLLIMIAIYVFVIYVLVSVLRFMKKKSELDQARNEKLDKLIQVLEANSGKE